MGRALLVAATCVAVVGCYGSESPVTASGDEVVIEDCPAGSGGCYYLIRYRRGRHNRIGGVIDAEGGTMTRNYPEIGVAEAFSASPTFGEDIDSNSIVLGCSSDIEVHAPPVHVEAAVALDTDDGGAEAAPAAFASCQWPLDVMGVRDVWVTGNRGQHNRRVAVLDTGVDANHVDLAGKVDLEHSASMLSPGVGCTPEDEASFQDFDFHGTFVSAQIATNGIGIDGVANDVEIVGFKVLSCNGSGTFRDVLAGFMEATRTRHVEVINMSLGALLPPPGVDPMLDEFYEILHLAHAYAQRRGILAVSAAGNEGVDLDAPRAPFSVPAMVEPMLSVAATTRADALTRYSNHGAIIDLSAPGGDYPNDGDFDPSCPLPPELQGLVLSACNSRSLTLPPSFGCSGGASYVLAAGTSMAAPHTAGVAMLVDHAGGDLRAAPLERILERTAVDLGAPGVDGEFGGGRVDAAAGAALAAD